MKKFFRKVLYALGAVVLVIILFLILYIVRMVSAKKHMTPVETMQITDDVYAVKDKYANMYLIRDGSDFVAIDAGVRRGSVKDELKKLNIDPDDVRAVILTHSDSDHAGGIKLFDRADIYLPKQEEQMINGETGRFLWFGNNLDTKEYKLLDDNTFRIGDVKIQPIPTPGHTAGATCYLVNDRYLFTGDALRLYNGTVEPFPKFINKDTRKARKSMNNITGLSDVQYIFTAHYGYTDDYKTAVAKRRKRAGHSR